MIDVPHVIIAEQRGPGIDCFVKIRQSRAAPRFADGAGGIRDCEVIRRDLEDILTQRMKGDLRIMKKKVLSVLLTLAMVLTLLPVTALADVSSSGSNGTATLIDKIEIGKDSQ